MMENKINFTIPDEVILQTKTHLTEAVNLLKPYLIALSPDERKSIPKMSDKTAPFVDKCLDYSNSAPQFAPPYMDIAAMAADLKVNSQLTPLFRIVQGLFDGLDDTVMESGAEAYLVALGYYNSVKQAAKMDVPGAKAIYEDLRKRFEKAKNGNGNPPEPATE